MLPSVQDASKGRSSARWMPTPARWAIFASSASRGRRRFSCGVHCGECTDESGCRGVEPGWRPAGGVQCRRGLVEIGAGAVDGGADVEEFGLDCA